MRSVPSIPSMESLWSNTTMQQQEGFVQDNSSIWNDNERTNWLTFNSPSPELELKIDVMKIVEDEDDDVEDDTNPINGGYNRLSVFRKINSN